MCLVRLQVYLEAEEQGSGLNWRFNLELVVSKLVHYILGVARALGSHQNAAE